MLLLVRHMLDAHRRLPKLLRVWSIAPITVLGVAIGGLAFPLPTGPLCDEGMVLFMEGGCDWGRSNVFFFSKAGLLLGLNLSFCLAWRHRVSRAIGFIPHFAILVVVSWLFLSDPDCDRYYSHPNGSIGQMTIEAMAFAILGIELVRRFAASPRQWSVVAFVVGWNGFHVGVFYLGLYFTHHWTWLHTFWIAAVLVGTACALRLTRGSSGLSMLAS